MAKWRLKGRLVRAAITAAATCALAGHCPAWAGLSDMLQNLDPDKPFSRAMPPTEKLNGPPKEPQLEDMFVRTDIPVQPLIPFSLEGTKVAGLTERTVHQLAAEQFIVVDNSRFHSMTDIYRDNRLRGKPNFVTADSIIHPYFAFTNGVAAAVIQKYVVGDLQGLLDAMFDSAILQYKEAQDSDVRDDIEKNLGYLIVALKLLHPEATIPVIGQANVLAERELKNVQGGKTALSPIFGRQQDYSFYQPVGWYASSATLSNFYKCHAWLSHTNFTLSDPAFGSTAGKGAARSIVSNAARSPALKDGTGGGAGKDEVNGVAGTVAISGGASKEATGSAASLTSAGTARTQETGTAASSNEFRRSVLLYQNLQQAKVGNMPAYGVWKKLSALLDVLGAGALQRERLLCPADYNAVFGLEKRISLNGLSEPLYRTKLLLTVRRSKPIEVGAASIFNQTEQKNSSDTSASFLLFPPTEDFEIAWLKERAHSYTPEGAEGPDSPLALFDLYAHASAQASNLLSDMIWHLDPALSKQLPPLVKSLKAVGQQTQYSLGHGRWQILEQYFKPFLEGSQAPLRTTPFLSRHIESAFAGWVDSKLSLSPLAPTTQSAHVDPSTTDGATKASAANFQYLEPCPDLYRKIATDSRSFMQQLMDCGSLPEGAKDKFQDFSRLSSRLAGIADRELAYQPVAPVDMKLLADIDLILDKVSVPLQGTLYLNTGEAGKGGCNLCLGRVGYLHVLCRTTQGVMLCRGAVYTYYEIPGGPITAQHWERKLQFALVRPPDWTTEFDIVQEANIVRTTSDTKDASGSSTGTQTSSSSSAGSAAQRTSSPVGKSAATGSNSSSVSLPAAPVSK